MVSTAALKPGPIDFSVETMDMTATARALFESRLVQEGNDVNLEDLTIGEPKSEAIDESVVAIQGTVQVGVCVNRFHKKATKKIRIRLSFTLLLRRFFWCALESFPLLVVTIKPMTNQNLLSIRRVPSTVLFFYRCWAFV